MKTFKNIYLFMTGRKNSKYLGFLSQRLLLMSSGLLLAGISLMLTMLVVDWLGAKVMPKDYLIVGAMFIGMLVLLVGFVGLPAVLRILLAWLFPKSSGLGLLQWHINSAADETIWWAAILLVILILYAWLSATSFLLAQVISYVGCFLLVLIFMAHNAEPGHSTKT